MRILPRCIRERALAPSGDPLNPRPRRRRRQRGERRGTALVEFAVIAPLFVLLVMGIIEFGRAMMVKQVLTNAAREGARRAIVESATESEVKDVVRQYLTGASVNSATITVTPTDLAGLGFGDTVTVSVSVSSNSIAWTPSRFLGGRTLKESTTMRAERLQ